MSHFSFYQLSVNLNWNVFSNFLPSYFSNLCVGHKLNGLELHSVSDLFMMNGTLLGLHIHNCGVKSSPPYIGSSGMVWGSQQKWGLIISFLNLQLQWNCTESWESAWHILNYISGQPPTFSFHDFLYTYKLDLLFYY